MRAPLRLAALHSRAATPPPAGGWTPADLGSAVVGWWDAQDNATLTTSGGAVSAWASKVGSVSLAQATSGNRPTLNATALSSRPGVVFDGSNDFLSSAVSTFPTGSATSTMVIVFKLSSAGSYPIVFAQGTSNLRAARIIYGSASTGNAGVSIYGDGDYNTGVSATAAPVIVVAQYFSDHIRVSVNGGAATDVNYAAGGTLDTNTSSILTLGANPEGDGNICACVIGEAYTINRAVTTGEEAQIVAYETAHWGL